MVPGLLLSILLDASSLAAAPTNPTSPRAGDGAAAGASASPGPDLSFASIGAPATGVDFVPDRIVVRLVPAAARAAAMAARLAATSAAPATVLERIGVPALDRTAAALGARFEQEFLGEIPPAPGSGGTDFTAYWVVHLPPGCEPSRAIAAFGALADVGEAHPVALASVAGVFPRDSLWGRAHHLYQASRRDMHAPEAWSITRGDTAIIVAIVDTGILPYHPDLTDAAPGGRNQLWTNWREASGRPGVDDDGNGFVDDVWGWDFVETAPDPYPGEDVRDADNDPNDYAGHGTAVAGVLGALTDNGIGIAGTAWDIRLMALRVGYSATSNTQGKVDMMAAAKAVRYATRMGAGVINCSFTSAAEPELTAAVDAAVASGVFMVIAAGNLNDPNHMLNNRGDGISVTATDSLDRIAPFSSLGSWVDMCAPGTNLPTTTLRRLSLDSLGYRQPAYTTGANGTSFSAPLTAGVAALVQADRRARGLRPLRPMELKLRLMDTADDISALNSALTGYGVGRLNAYRALTDPPSSVVMPLGAPTVGPAAVIPTSTGGKRVVTATADGRLLFIDGASGDTVRSVALPAAPIGGISAAGLRPGDGPALFVATADRKIRGFDGVGDPLPGWPVSATGVAFVRSLEPALGDLDGDGETEVVWGGNDGYVYAWRRDGTRVGGFPRFVGGQGQSILIALSDLDGAPGAEIVAANAWGSVHALRGDGTELPAPWPIGILLVPSPPVVARLATTGEPGIFIAAGGRLGCYARTGVQILDIAVPGTQVDAPALADLDGDGHDEIILGRVVPDEIVVLDQAGAPLASLGWPLTPNFAPVGPPVVGSLGPGGAPGVAVCLRRTTGVQLMAWGADARGLRGFPRPGHPGQDPTISDLNGDRLADVAGGSGADGSLYLYRTGAHAFVEEAQQWPTPRGNFARTGSRLYAPPLPAADDLPPVAVGDLRADTVGSHEAALDWSAPADPGLEARVFGYELRWSAAPIDESNFTLATPVEGPPLPGPPGTAERMVVRGLREGRTHHFALRSVDRARNASPISNVVTLVTTDVAPARVADLRVSAADDSSVTLRWTATGDDGASGEPARYLVRGAPAALDEAGFDRAPLAIALAASKPAGGVETARVAGLRRGERYCFALRAEDAAGNRSVLSNVVARFAGPLSPARGVALAVGAAPARAPVDLYWQGDGTSPAGQTLRVYDLAGRQLATFAVTGADGKVTWNGCDDGGRALPAGMYFARLTSGTSHARAKLVLLR
jgi:subtilisin family serine protease